MKRPDREIGPPPHKHATSGRMNANGISVFYGATDPDIALAEVRPPVGSKVLIGRFEFLRVVRLLNQNALRSVTITGSLFDMSYKRTLERVEFLKWLSNRITLPVMPDDERFEYLATQAVADFLASSVQLRLDGILYPSVQGGDDHFNIVLFHKSSRVQSFDIPEGTEINAKLYEHYSDDDGLYPWVFEDVPANTSQLGDPSDSANSVDKLMPRLRPLKPEDFDEDIREPTLRLDPAQLKIHLVKAVRFETKHTVHRTRKIRSK